MRRALQYCRSGMRKAYQGVREWCGDAAYEKYATCVQRAGGKTPLTPKEFYVDQLNRKYSRPNRCC
jgi:hypothetical protein